MFSPNIIDFITVSSEYCKHLEQCQNVKRSEFVRTMLTLLPMLYIKTRLLETLDEVEGYNEPKVTEEDYNYIRQSVNLVLGDADDYLDVFIEDFKYSDQAVLRSISEDLADIYQQLRDMLEVFRAGYDDAIALSLNEVRENFHLFWGQRLLGAMRAMHEINDTNDD